jgi:glutaredoxin
MKRIAIITTLAILSAAPAGAAQLYRWVDDKGNVEYRDTPPPSSAKKVEELRSIPTGPQSSHVTLWNSNCGAPCEQGRAYLTRRGVPFAEMDPANDIEAFKRLTGGTDVPVLFVGTTRINGFNEKIWESALDSAGYARTGTPGATAAARKPRADLPPVRLFTHPECGAACNGARKVLTGRGIQFEEVVAQEDSAIAELRQVSGDTRVPVLLVGGTVMRGFHEPNYQDLLDAQGFPRRQ